LQLELPSHAHIVPPGAPQSFPLVHWPGSGWPLMTGPHVPFAVAQVWHLVHPPKAQHVMSVQWPEEQTLGIEHVPPFCSRQSPLLSHVQPAPPAAAQP
jgi:hypothetical protein